MRREMMMKGMMMKTKSNTAVPKIRNLHLIMHRTIGLTAKPS